MNKQVLVLGARGRFGGAAAQAFLDAGWQVRAQTRPGRSVQSTSRLQWVNANTTDTTALSAAAQGCSVVVQAINPAYTNAAWEREWPGLIDTAIAVALQHQALLVLPGNVYNFGATMPPMLHEDTAQQATTRKGKARIALEQQLAQACAQRGLQAVVLRAGDFFGSGTGSWLDRMMAKKLRQGEMQFSNAADVPTPWAYLPDLAHSLVRVVEQRNQLGAYEVLHYAGYQLRRSDWIEALTHIAVEQGWMGANQTPRVRYLPWPLMRALSPVVPLFASLLEMRYLTQTPHALDDSKLRALIGQPRMTPFPQAVRQSLADLGMLDRPAPGPQSRAPV